LIRSLKIILASLLVLVLPILAKAEAPHWQIVPNASSLTFTATQNGAPVTGTFKIITGEISFAPDQLANSAVNIKIDMNSLSASYSEMVDTLKSADWFDVKKFPLAEFKSTSFTKLDDKKYQANGSLTIRDKTLPVTLNFVLDEFSTSNANVTGTATIQRTAFGVGQGEWAKTDAVKDEVKIVFVLKSTKK